MKNPEDVLAKVKEMLAAEGIDLDAMARKGFDAMVEIFEKLADAAIVDAEGSNDPFVLSKKVVGGVMQCLHEGDMEKMDIIALLGIGVAKEAVRRLEAKTQ